MRPDRDAASLDDIELAVRRIQEFLGRSTRDEFLVDVKTQSAVIHQLLIVGEATKRLSPETRARFEVPWADVARMRDKMIHHYEAVDIELVWTAATVHAPHLLAAIGGRRSSAE